MVDGERGLDAVRREAALLVHAAGVVHEHVQRRSCRSRSDRASARTAACEEKSQSSVKTSPEPPRATSPRAASVRAGSRPTITTRAPRRANSTEALEADAAGGAGDEDRLPGDIPGHAIRADATRGRRQPSSLERLHHAAPGVGAHIRDMAWLRRSKRRRVRHLLAWAAGGAGALSLSYAAYVARTWWRYGRGGGGGGDDPLLDRFLPDWDVRERHQVRVAASPELTWAVARNLDLDRSWIIRAIFRSREWLFRSRPEARARGPLVDQTLALGWGVLAQDPGHHLVMGAVAEPWRADVRFRALPPDDFTRFTEPGHAKILWTLSVEPGPAGSLGLSHRDARGDHGPRLEGPLSPVLGGALARHLADPEGGAAPGQGRGRAPPVDAPPLAA